MSTLKISKHSDVPTALDIVREEVENEANRIYAAGGEALKAKRIEPAKEAIAYAEDLGAFVKKIQALRDEWRKLEAKIDAAAPDVKEIVLPPASPMPRAVTKGFTRMVGHIAPKTNFTVTFPDGTVIADSKAAVVLAKTIEKLSVEDVAKLGLLLGGEPLVTKVRADLKKYPAAVVAISKGWYVATHCDTLAKIAIVEKIAKALKVKLVVTQV